MCAFVRAGLGAAPPDLAAVRRHLAIVGVARQKWPDELHVVDDFPRTPSSKVKKFVLREQVRAAAAAGEPNGVRSSVDRSSRGEAPR